VSRIGGGLDKYIDSLVSSGHRTDHADTAVRSLEAGQVQLGFPPRLDPKLIECQHEIDPALPIVIVNWLPGPDGCGLSECTRHGEEKQEQVK
jgi:hypothetical protein